MKRKVTQELYDRIPDELKGDYEVEIEKWMPDIKPKQLYWFTDLQGRVNSTKKSIRADTMALLSGNGYTSQEKAEKAESILRPIRRVVQYLVENDVDTIVQTFKNSDSISFTIFRWNDDNLHNLHKAIELLEKEGL